MFPSDWAERKGASATSKRRKVQQKDEARALMEQCETTLANDTSATLTDGHDDYDSIVNVIKRQVNDSKFLPPTPEEIQLDHVLSSVPYQALLESLFGGVNGPAPEVPIVSKIYEESYMREPLPGERPCVMGERCECMFIDRNAPFVGAEFVLPGQMAETTDEPKMCVLCYRRTTQKLFYDVCYSGKRVQGLIQHYGNLCNQPGEYARECMLICPPGSQWQGMPVPVMSHQRNRYRVVVRAGVKYLQQLRVSFEDFFASPPGKLFCPEDASLDEEISRLHELARSGTYYDSIQAHIDSYLPAVAFMRENPCMKKVARMMVTTFVQSPQEGNLPDLCGMIRSMLDGSGDRFSGSHAFSCMHQALPCVKKEARKSAKIDKDYQLSINVLLGLLLGLYPSSLKFPPFAVRVSVYRRVHALLTHGTGVHFCNTFSNLIALAYMEYCAHVITSYMPAEHETLCCEPGIQHYFQSCPMVCDGFRQDMLLTGEEPWAELDSTCVAIVERHARACKNRARGKGSGSSVCIKVPPELSEFYMSLPYVHPYAVHFEDPSHCIMAGELKFLLDQGETMGVNDANLEHAVAIQRLIHAHSLPSNLLRVQIQSLARRSRVCQRSAMSGTKLYLCIPCILRGPNTLKPSVMRGMCKLDVDSGDYTCTYCANPNIVHLNALGKIVLIRNHRFYYAPCCNTVQPYAARGDEFYETLDPASLALRVQCPHQKPKVQQRPPRQRCAVCGNVAAHDAHTSVDHLTGELHTVYLCSRHTPNQYALKQAVNWEQLTDEILKRDKPLFAISALSRRGKKGYVSDDE